MNYYEFTKFEWNPDKSDVCFQNRGFDFRYVISAFKDPDQHIARDLRFDYSEARYRLLGKIEGRVFVVIFTSRNGFVRIISARKANKREQRHYENRAHDT